MVSVRRHARYWRTYLAGGGLVLVLGASAPPGQPSQHRAEDTEAANHSPAANQQKTEQPPLTAKPKDPLTTETRPDSPSANHEDEGGPKWTDIATAFAAVVSACFAVALWRSTDKLWEETKRLAAGAEDQTKEFRASLEVNRGQMAAAERSAEASEKSAEAALLQSRLSERIFESVERPYIVLVDIESVIQSGLGGIKGYGGAPLIGQPIQCSTRFNVQNVGRTPANILEIVFKMSVEEVFPEYFDYRRRNMILVDVVLPPGDKIEGYRTEPISGVEIREGNIVDGKHVFFYGFIYYTDMSGNNYIKKCAYRFVGPRRYLTLKGKGYNSDIRYDPPGENPASATE